ncbi:DUF4828 domain-containing protein [Enterococcus sp. DIV0660C]|uniref:DUF4828 domain-containing protein n=1 Tax=Enterococcus sp. DIV0660C TaxID=2230880 RepID=UPI001A8F2F56|nr:DUF4828 domain-containing protein [Enterococcus sp. DIV0660C]MBO0432457.1 DUF4828 domain-containing protein [Enterococcus sp. DIV0660C]
MKKRISYLIGMSLLTLLGGVAVQKRQQKKQEKTIDATTYVRTWYFQDHHHQPHQLTVLPEYTLVLDQQPIQATIIELNTQKFVVRDQYGYHLILTNQSPMTFYDEAEDVSYILSKKEQ